MYTAQLLLMGGPVRCSNTGPGPGPNPHQPTLGDPIVSTNITASPATDQPHAATLRQPRRAVAASTSEPEPVRADIGAPHPDWCERDWDPTETGDRMEHAGDITTLDLSLPNLHADGRDPSEGSPVMTELYAEALRRGDERLIEEIERPYVPFWSVHLSQPHGGEPVVWLGRDESNRGADMTPDEAERLGGTLLELAEAARKGAGR